MQFQFEMKRNALQRWPGRRFSAENLSLHSVWVISSSLLFAFGTLSEGVSRFALQKTCLCLMFFVLLKNVKLELSMSLMRGMRQDPIPVPFALLVQRPPLPEGLELLS